VRWITSILYVHVADDGGILVIEGDTGRPAWVVEAELVRRLDVLKRGGGSVLLSQGLGSPVAASTLKLIQAVDVPIIQSREVHPDAVRGGGATTLMFAAYVGAMEVAQDLVRRGAALEAQDEEGFTALMYAANAGQDQLIQVLIDASADVNHADHTGATALVFAAQHGHLGIVRRLLAAGADSSVRRVGGLTAHDFAARNGHQRVAAALLLAEGKATGAVASG
jgi:hypothetical protein